MKKQNPRAKLFAVFIALNLCVSFLAACVSPQSSTPAASEASGSTASASETSGSTAAASETSGSTAAASETSGSPAKVSITFTGGPVTELWAQSNEVKLLKEKLNIELDYSFVDNDKFALMLAGGELSDIVSTRQQFLGNIIDNNMAMDLAPLLEQYAPNMLLDIYKTSNQLSSTLLGGKNNQLFFVAPCLGPEYTNSNDGNIRGYSVRWDLYKQIGCPPINNDDDYIEVLRKMVDINPKTENGLPVYGIGLDNRLPSWWTRAAFIRSGGAVNLWTFSGYPYMAGWDDSVLYDGYTNTNRSAYWTDMKFYNKLYNAGLLDPDSFVMTMDEVNAKTAAGQYTGGAIADNNLFIEMLKKDPNTLAGQMMIPSPNAVIFSDRLVFNGNMPTDSLFIPAKSQNWKAALAVLNFFRDPEMVRVSYNGVKGVDWDYDENGNTFITDKALQDRQQYSYGSDAYQKATGIIGYLNEWSPFSGSAIHPDGHFYEIAQEYKYRAMVLSPLQKDYADFYGYSSPSEYHMSFINSGKTFGLIDDYASAVSIGVNAIPLDIQRIMNACNDIIYRALPELVMAPNEAEFSSIQQRVFADLQSAEEIKAWNWCENAFNTSKKVVKPIFEEAKASYLERSAKK